MEGPREKEEREWPTRGRQVFERIQRQVACSSNWNHLPEPLCKSGDGWEATVRAGIFHVLGSQGWEQVQDMERQGLPGRCTGLKLGAGGCLWEH